MDLNTEEPYNWDIVTLRNRADQLSGKIHRQGYPKCMDNLVDIADALFDKCEEIPANEENLNAMYAAVVGMYLAVEHIRDGMIDDLNGCY